MSISSTSDITDEIPYWATLIGESIENPVPITGIWKECALILEAIVLINKAAS